MLAAYIAVTIRRRRACLHLILTARLIAKGTEVFRSAACRANPPCLRYGVRQWMRVCYLAHIGKLTGPSAFSAFDFACFDHLGTGIARPQAHSIQVAHTTYSSP